MTKRSPLDGLTGLEALAEISKRLGALPEQVKAAMQNADQSEASAQSHEREFTINTPAGPLKGVTSMSFRTGTLAGAARRNFGNAPSAAARAERPRRPTVPDLDSAREPLVDCFDEGEEIVVTAEMPGVRPDEVSLNVEDGALVISTTGARRYRAVQPLPVAVLAASLTPELRNGILSVRIKKSAA